MRLAISYLVDFCNCVSETRDRLAFLAFLQTLALAFYDTARLIFCGLELETYNHIILFKHATIMKLIA